MLTLPHFPFPDLYPLGDELCKPRSNRTSNSSRTHTVPQLLRAAFVSMLGFALVSVSLNAQSGSSAAAAMKKKDTLRTQTAEITVSAARANSLSSQPVSFTDITHTELSQKQSVYDIPSLLADLPSVVFYSDNANGIGYSYLTMRGFDQRRIAVLINGIPQNDPEDHNVYWIDFPDLSSSLDNIQVQRGAGLVSYGAPAIGGSINLSTVNIAQRRFAKLSLGAGVQEHAGVGINAAPADISSFASSKKAFEVCTGLDAHNTAFYARLSEIQSRGYRDNSWSNLQSFFVSAGSFQEDYSVQLNVFGGPISDGLAYTGMPKSFIKNTDLRRSNDNYWEYDSTGAVGYRAARRQRETESFSQPHFEVLCNLTLSPNIDLSSSLFYYTGRGFFDYDGSWADAATLRLTSAFGGSDSIASPTNTMIRAWVQNRQIGWIPQLRWRHEGGELYFGAELRSHNSEHWANIAYAENLPAGFDQEFKVYSYEGHRTIGSVFAREQYRLSSSLSLNLEAQLNSTSYALSNEKAGLVYTSYTTTDGSTVGNGAELFHVNYVFFNPRIGLSWRVDEQQQSYLCIAQTKREPRMANLYAAEESFYSGAGPLFASDTAGGKQRYNFSSPLIKPESLLDIELGWSLRRENLRLSATAYFMDFHDEHVSNGARDIFGNPIVGNAPHTRHMGIELQAACTLWSHNNNEIELNGNLCKSSNTILEYSYQLQGKTIDLANNTISRFPSTIANLHLILKAEQFSFDLGLRALGSMYSDNFGDKLGLLRSQNPGAIAYSDNVVDAATVLNAAMSYRLQDLFGLRSTRLLVQVNNLTNKLYASGANGQEFFPAAERNWYFGIEIEP